MLGDDDPARFVIEPDGLSDPWRNLNPNRITCRWRMRNGEDHYKAGPRWRVAGCDQTGRTIFSLVAARDGLLHPQVIISYDQPRLRLRQRHGGRLFHQFVKTRVLRIHL